MTMWTPQLSADVKSIYEAIAQAIGDDVVSGKLQPGERLPTQRALSKRLSVTIGTVGRAYALAEKRGLVSLEVGRGSYVRSFESRSGTSGKHQQIDLGLNLPPATEKVNLLAGTLAQLANSRDIAMLFGNAPVQSREHHRVAAATWLGDRIECLPEDVLICSGTQNALVSILATLTRPGDSVLVEELTFPGMIAVARLLHLKLVPVARDDQGVVPAALDKASRNTKVLYCIPTNHNPTTITIPRKRRQEIASIAARRKLVVIEDDAYGKLIENSPPPIASLLPDQTFLICPLAKTMSVGLRLAYVRVPKAYREPMIANMRASNFFPAPLLCEIAASWISDGTADRLLTELREKARQRQEIAREVFGELKFLADPGGNHIWLILPDTWTAETLVRAANENGVNLFAASAFTLPEWPTPNAVRVALGGASNESELRTGLNVIVRLLKEKTEPSSAKY